MFIETHSDNDITLTFIKSANIQAYPCGRRRSTVVDRDGSSGTTDDQYYFPFDPEARLNTEANNRKQSSQNGYTQTYLKDWDVTNKLLTLSLAGYLFKISLPDDHCAVNDFGAKVIAQLADTSATSIYANVLLEDVHLFSGFKEYYTSILRNQSDSSLPEGIPETSLDLPDTTTVNSGSRSLENLRDFNNYYFSGLSFSTTPLSGEAITRSYVQRTVERDGLRGITAKQYLVSLRLLKKSGSTWVINEPARLPLVEHGETVDSIVVGDTLVKDDLTVENHTKSKTVEVTDRTTTKNLTVTTKATIKEEAVETADIETADINTLTGNKATYATVEGTTLVKGKELLQNGYKVPTIELVKSGTEWQLKITKIGAKS